MARPRFTSLRSRLILSIIPLILLFMGFNFLVLTHHEEQTLRRETEKRASMLAAELSLLSAEAKLTFSRYLLDQYTTRFADFPDVVYAMVLGPDGEVQAHSSPGERGKIYDDEANRSALASPGERIAYLEHQGRPVLDVARPITIDERRMGTVRIGLSLDRLEQARAQSRRYLTGLTLVLLAGGIAFTGLLTRWFTEPLYNLARVARELAMGNLDTRAPRRPELGEVGLLGAALNHMADRLHGLLRKEQRERQDLQQRVHNLLEFTESVMSGDLRRQAPENRDDDLGMLTRGINEMTRHLRSLLEEERAMRRNLEESKRALEQANRKLLEVDRLKSEFLNTVSHELRTPLTAIKAFAEILLEEGPASDDGQRREFLEIINQESDRLTRLINNLLDLSRIEAGKMHWDFQPTDLAEVVNTAAVSLRASAEAKDLVYVVQCEKDLMLWGDRDKLIQVVMNLIGNAIKFTPEGGRIRIAARRAGEDELELVVADSGIGIPPEYHQVIFESFGRVDSSETREVKGTGLGLTIAWNFVQAHQGTLTVESERGKGATFRITLPALTRVGASSPPGGDEGAAKREPQR